MTISIEPEKLTKGLFYVKVDGKLAYSTENYPNEEKARLRKLLQLLGIEVEFK